VLSIIVAFHAPGTWFVPIAYQIISFLSYLPYLFAVRPQMILPPAAWLNAVTVGFLLWKQWRMTSNEDAN
jgi:hypothetical protein